MDAFRRWTIQQAHQRHMAELAYWVSSLHWQRRQLIDEEFQINKGQPEKMRERTRVSSKAIFGFVASLKDWCKRIAACLWTRATGSLANVTRQLLFTRKERMKTEKGTSHKTTEGKHPELSTAVESQSELESHQSPQHTAGLFLSAPAYPDHHIRRLMHHGLLWQSIVPSLDFKR